jgi:hypothetical protein
LPRMLLRIRGDVLAYCALAFMAAVAGGLF